MNIVDLRSDTVTRPTAEMRAAIAAADVGDDVLGDDPTVIRLQERCAELLGKPAALYVPSGSMANQSAIWSWCHAGDEIICDQTSHIYNYEGGAPSALTGASLRLLAGPRGIFDALDVDAAVRPPDSHFPQSRLLVVENTNNRGGGSVWPLEQLTRVTAAARRHGLAVHLDGARLMNAVIASGVRPTDITQHVDSVSTCFSKGLGAPVGSVIAGPREFVQRCHRARKLFGGGMRQSGLLAAAALYALDHHVERLATDHANARRLGLALAEMPGILLDPRTVETNIVIFGVHPALGTAAQLAQRLGERGVRLFATGPDRCRAVTHLDVSSAQIDQAIGVFREICRAKAA